MREELKITKIPIAMARMKVYRLLCKLITCNLIKINSLILIHTNNSNLNLKWALYKYKVKINHNLSNNNNNLELASNSG